MNRTVQLEDVRDVSIGEVDTAREAECPICKVDLESDDEIWTHDRCGMSFHADCFRSWHRISCTCSYCRRHVCYHVHHELSEETDADIEADQLHREMIRLTREPNNSSFDWTQYWTDRQVRFQQLGAAQYAAQPGYIPQQDFRIAAEQARSDYRQELIRIINEFRPSVPRFSRREDRGDNAAQSQSAGESDLTEDQASATTPAVPRRQNAESLGRWNLYAARSDAEDDESTEYERACSRAREDLVNAVDVTRAVLENSKEADARGNEWEEDPPNPY